MPTKRSSPYISRAFARAILPVGLRQRFAPAPRKPACLSSTRGNNGDGELGITSALTNTNAPAVPSTIGGYVAITAGDTHTCALMFFGDGLVLGRRFRRRARRRHGQRRARSADGRVVGHDRRSVCEHEPYVCTARDDDTVACWGDGSHGELGGGLHAQLAPQQVALPAAATAIAANTKFACALVAGSVYCWGSDEAAHSSATRVPRRITRAPLRSRSRVSPVPPRSLRVACMRRDDTFRAELLGTR